MFIDRPVQMFPSPWKPELQTHTGRSPPSSQKAFGPQDGEQPTIMAKGKASSA